MPCPQKIFYVCAEVFRASPPVDLKAYLDSSDMSKQGTVKLYH
jgi:hypothetical protein